MKNITRADAINLFDHLDRAMDLERPRLAARRVIGFIFEVNGSQDEEVREIYEAIESEERNEDAGR